jgi:hypothetical protein
VFLKVWEASIDEIEAPTELEIVEKFDIIGETEIERELD